MNWADFGFGVQCSTERKREREREQRRYREESSGEDTGQAASSSTGIIGRRQGQEAGRRFPSASFCCRFCFSLSLVPSPSLTSFRQHTTYSVRRKKRGSASSEGEERGYGLEPHLPSLLSILVSSCCCSVPSVAAASPWLDPVSQFAICRRRRRISFRFTSSSSYSSFSPDSHRELLVPHTESKGC